MENPSYVNCYDCPVDFGFCILAVHAPAKRIRNMPITATINEL